MIFIFKFALLCFIAFSCEKQRWINSKDKICLENTPKLDVERFGTREELLKRIQEIKNQSFEMSENTNQQISSKFACVLLNKLKDGKLKRQMLQRAKLQLGENWNVKSLEYFQYVLAKYFEELQSLESEKQFENIIDVAKELGQLDSKINAFKAEYYGDLEKSFGGEFAEEQLPKETDRRSNLEWIRDNFTNETTKLQVFHSTPNFFGSYANGKTSSLSHAARFSKNSASCLSHYDHSGSLNTYNDKSTSHGFESLSQLKIWADNLVSSDKQLSISERIYLIWKTAGYTTPDHQDVHQKQHLVSYHQMRGKAFFHMLPPICGLYLAHLYGKNDLGGLREAVKYFDEREVGGYIELIKGEIIFLPPDKTHMVQVPYEDDEKVDYVRAFEILFDYEAMHEELNANRTNEVQNDSETESEDLEDENKTCANTDHEETLNESDIPEINNLPGKEQYVRKGVWIRKKRKTNLEVILFQNEVELFRFKSEKCAQEALDILEKQTKPKNLTLDEITELIKIPLDDEVKARIEKTALTLVQRKSTTMQIYVGNRRNYYTFQCKEYFEKARYEVMMEIIKSSMTTKKRQESINTIMHKYKILDKQKFLQDHPDRKIEKSGKGYRVRHHRLASWASRTYFNKDDAQKLRDLIEQNAVSGNMKLNKENLCKLQDSFMDKKSFKKENKMWEITKSHQPIKKRKRPSLAENKFGFQKSAKQKNKKKDSGLQQKSFTRDSSVSSIFTNESDDFKIPQKKKVGF